MYCSLILPTEYSEFGHTNVLRPLLSDVLRPLLSDVLRPLLSDVLRPLLSNVLRPLLSDYENHFIIMAEHSLIVLHYITVWISDVCKIVKVCYIVAFG